MPTHKFIANYTLACGREWINHITTVGCDGCLAAVEPLSSELAATRYVSGVLVVVPADAVRSAMAIAGTAADREELLVAAVVLGARVGEAVAVIERDFVEGITRRLL